MKGQPLISSTVTPHSHRLGGAIQIQITQIDPALHGRHHAIAPQIRPTLAQGSFPNTGPADFRLASGHAAF
jgi:hypothetical protein